MGPLAHIPRIAKHLLVRGSFVHIFDWSLAGLVRKIIGGNTLSHTQLCSLLYITQEQERMLK